MVFLFPPRFLKAGQISRARHPLPSRNERTAPAPAPQPPRFLSPAHPVSRARGGAGGAARGRGRVPKRGRAEAALARGAGCCWPRRPPLQVCAGGHTRCGCCARGGLLASGLPQPGWARSAGGEPGTGASCSRNRLYTLAPAVAWWPPPGRHSRLASLPTGANRPAGSLWARPMPTKRARVSGRKLLQGFQRGRPGQGAGAGGLMAPGGRPGERCARGESGGWQAATRAAGGLRLGPLLAAHFSSSGRPEGWSGERPGLRALRSASALGPRLEAHGGAPSRLLPLAAALPKANWQVFIFGNLSLIFSSLLSTPCPPPRRDSSAPLITREGERNSSNTHFGTAKRAGGKGG